MFNWSQKLTVGGKRKEKTNFVQEIDSWEKKNGSGNQIRNWRACLVNNTTYILVKTFTKMIFKDKLKMELYNWESSADQKNEVPLR